LSLDLNASSAHSPPGDAQQDCFHWLLGARRPAKKSAAQWQGPAEATGADAEQQAAHLKHLIDSVGSCNRS